MFKTKLKNIVYFFYGFWNLFRFLVFDLKKIRDAEVVCFFPYYHTGGAERVHLNIVKALADKNVCVIFTLNSATKNFQEQFQANAQCIEINPILNKKNKLINSLLKRSIVKAINTSKKCKSVFSSNSVYFYQLLPLITDRICRIDLYHAFSKEDSRESEVVDSLMYINKRVVISENTKKDLLRIYNKYQVIHFFDRIYTIQNGVKISNQFELFKDFSNIKIGFVGRWAEEKRPALFLEIAKKINLIYPSIEFLMIGTGMKSNHDVINEAGVVFLGEITNNDELSNFYKELTFLLITSEYEGFPMVIMESMLQGVVPISTDVGGISEHITNYENGVLITDAESEKIISAFTNAIELLVMDKVKIQGLSQNAFNYAKNNFGINQFNENYKKLFDV